MSLSTLYVGLFLLAFACLPMAIKWMQQRIANHHQTSSGSARIVSAVAVGPTQRVVTVEVGPEEERLWLVLGVTSQNIACLHSGRAPSTGSAAVPSGLEVHSKTSEWRE